MNRTLIKKQCVICGKEFRIGPHIKKHDYCSKACRSVAKTDDESDIYKPSPEEIEKIRLEIKQKKQKKIEEKARIRGWL